MGVVVGRERETLTIETLSMQKWRGNGTKVDYDAREEENAVQILNLSL